MAILGDFDNNSVEIRSGATVGDYVITGKDGTSLQLNTSGTFVASIPVNGINGNIQVDLQDGTNKFDFEGPVGGQSTVLGGLAIINHAGGNTNIIHDTNIGGNLIVTKFPGSPGSCELQLARVTVIGDTLVDNQFGGGSGGSKTFIDDSQLQGGGGTALSITNGAGLDTLQVTKSDFGAGVFFPGAIVAIANGSGASKSTFTATAGTLTRIYGGLTIANGTNVFGTFDQVNFINTEVLGAVTIADAGGNTETTVSNSKLGIQLNIPAPTIIANNAGYDQFEMHNSEIPWGLLIDNDVAAAGTSVWGSKTTIDQNSLIGTSPFGPNLPPPALPLDGLHLRGDNGADEISITGTTIGGTANFDFLYNGNNKVTLNTSTLDALSMITGVGNDDLAIVECTIPVAVTVTLGNGTDRMKVIQNSVLPNPLLGVIVINGGLGVDTFWADATVYPALGIQPGFQFFQDWS